MSLYEISAIKTLDEFVQNQDLTDRDEKAITQDATNELWLDGDAWPRIESSKSIEKNEDDVAMEPKIIKTALMGIICKKCLNQATAYTDLLALDKHVADMTLELLPCNIKEQEIVKEKVTVTVSETLDTITNPAFVEDCNFDSDLFLPEKCDPLNFLKQMVNSQPFEKLLSKKKKWMDHILNNYACQILVYCFWYSWHQFWKPQQSKTIESLFDKISLSMVESFIRFKGKGREEFFRIYPEMMARACHLAFLSLFPNSTSLMSNDFACGLYDLIYHLFNGMHPSIMGCEAWGKAPGDALLTSKKDTQPERSIKTTTVPFDIYGNSPTMDHYLKKYGFRREQKRLRVMRHEVLLGSGAVNYKKLVMESLQNSNTKSNAYRVFQQDIVKERKRISRDLSKTMGLEDDKIEQIFANDQVKSFADQLVEEKTRDL